LAKRYTDIFEVFVKHADKIDRVTFWGVHDGHSWRNDWPIRGRSDYPLLFDRKLQPKPAFDAVLRTAGATSE
jgi:endo-1,4-beta-xylanase